MTQNNNAYQKGLNSKKLCCSGRGQLWKWTMGSLICQSILYREITWYFWNFPYLDFDQLSDTPIVNKLVGQWLIRFLAILFQNPLNATTPKTSHCFPVSNKKVAWWISEQHTTLPNALNVYTAQAFNFTELCQILPFQPNPNQILSVVIIWAWKGYLNTQCNETNMNKHFSPVILIENSCYLFKILNF